MLTEGENQYNWPPRTFKFRSAAFNNENFFCFFLQNKLLNKEVNRTEPSPSVRVPCQEHHIGRKKVLCDLSLEEVQTEMVLMGAGDNFRCLAAASSSEERYSEKHASLFIRKTR